MIARLLAQVQSSLPPSSHPLFSANLLSTSPFHTFSVQKTLRPTTSLPLNLGLSFSSASALIFHQNCQGQAEVLLPGASYGCY